MMERVTIQFTKEILIQRYKGPVAEWFLAGDF